MGVGHHILMISLPNITITVIIKFQHLACSQLIRTSHTLKSTQQYKHFTCMITIVIVRYLYLVLTPMPYFSYVPYNCTCD